MNLDANNAPKYYTKCFNVNNYHVFNYKIWKHEHINDVYTNTYTHTNTSYRQCINLPPHIYM